MLLGSVDHLHGEELVATLLKTGDDLADETTLDAIGLQNGSD